MHEHKARRTYRNWLSGQVLLRKDLTISDSVMLIRLKDARIGTTIGSIRYDILPRVRTLEVLLVTVANHRNDACAHNPNPGVGRLLMRIACENAAASGATRITANALTTAVGFYRRMGMHSWDTPEQIDGSCFAGGGRLSPAWLETMNTLVARTHAGGRMEAEIATVLRYIGPAVDAQWMCIRT